MKILRICIFILLLFCAFTNEGFAQLRSDRGLIKGRVLYISEKGNTFTIKNLSNGKIMTFTLKRGKVSDLSAGSDYVIAYKKDEPRIARKIRLIAKKKTEKAIEKDESEPAPSPVRTRYRYRE